MIRTIGDRPNRKGIDEFVREKDAHRLFRAKRSQIFKPGDARQEIRLGCTFLADAGHAGRLHDGVADRLEKIGRFRATPFQNVARELAIVRSLLGDPKRIGSAQHLPHLEKLPREQAPKKRPRADAGVKIAVVPDGRGAVRFRVIARARMIKREVHEPVEPHGSGGANLGADDFFQGCHASEIIR